jgi:hypothetical protein
MIKPNVKKAKKHLVKLSELVFKRKHPLSALKEEDVISSLRKTREEIGDISIVRRAS